MFYHEEDRKMAFDTYALIVENQANQQTNYDYIVQELVKMRQEITDLKLAVSYHAQIANEKEINNMIQKKKPGRKKKNAWY